MGDFNIFKNQGHVFYVEITEVEKIIVILANSFQAEKIMQIFDSKEDIAHTAQMVDNQKIAEIAQTVERINALRADIEEIIAEING